MSDQRRANVGPTLDAQCWPSAGPMLAQCWPNAGPVQLAARIQYEIGTQESPMTFDMWRPLSVFVAHELNIQQGGLYIDVMPLYINTEALISKVFQL